MATHIYCPNCGSKNNYLNGRKPNFCTNCRHDFNSLAVFGESKKTTNTRQTRVPSALDVSLEDEDEEVIGDAGISRADVDIQIESTKKVKVSDLIGTASSGFNDARQAMNTSTSKRDLKESFNHFKQEAGAGESKTIEI